MRAPETRPHHDHRLEGVGTLEPGRSLARARVRARGSGGRPFPEEFNVDLGFSHTEEEGREVVAQMTKGRDEGEAWQLWIRRHDEYEVARDQARPPVSVGTGR